MTAGLIKAYADVPLTKKVSVQMSELDIPSSAYIKNTVLGKASELKISLANPFDGYVFVSFVGSIDITVKKSGKVECTEHFENMTGIFDLAVMPVATEGEDCIAVISTDGIARAECFAAYESTGTKADTDAFRAFAGNKCFCRMPEDFGSVVKAERTVGNRVWDMPCEKFEYDGHLLCTCTRFSGHYEIEYNVKPPVISELHPEDASDKASENVYEISESRFGLASRWAAAQLCGTDNAGGYALLMNGYDALCKSLYVKKAPSARQRNTFFSKRACPAFAKRTGGGW